MPFCFNDTFCLYDVETERKPVTGKCTEGNKSINKLKSDWNSLYIAGEWIDRGNQPTIKDYDHYTQKVITEIPSATAEDVDKAFKSADRVQHTTTSSVWRLLNVSQSCEFHAYRASLPSAYSSLLVLHHSSHSLAAIFFNIIVVSQALLTLVQLIDLV